MDWKLELSSIEQRRDWKAAVNVLNKADHTAPEIYLRVMFLLIDFLVEGQYTKEDHDRAADHLEDIFNASSRKFSADPEFQFFAGKMIYIAEHYFGMNDIGTAAEMLKSANEREPDNTLYKWGYYSSIDQRPEVNTELKLQLSEKLLFNDDRRLQWLKSKGLLGEYILGMVEGDHASLRS